MPRPGFVLQVDERTPPLLVHQGEGYRMQKFPLGTRVVYPPDPLPGIRDVRGAVRQALLNPVGDSKPLPELLFPGMKLTIAIDDISIPLPPMRTPDIRQPILEHVIELAARRGVEDVELDHRDGPAPAHDLGRDPPRRRGARLPLVLPEHLKNFDAEDPQGLVEIGRPTRTSSSRSPSAPPRAT